MRCSTELPNGPWEKLAINYYGSLPSGEYVLVVIDEYLCFPEIDVTTSTSAKAALPKLDRILTEREAIRRQFFTLGINSVM